MYMYTYTYTCTHFGCLTILWATSHLKVIFFLFITKKLSRLKQSSGEIHLRVAKHMECMYAERQNVVHSLSSIPCHHFACTVAAMGQCIP